MTETDGLYLDGVLVATSEGIALTLTGNDLTKPDTQNASYTNTFSIPDSRQVRRLTSNAQQLDSASRSAYVPLPAQVISNGEVVFEGFAELSSYSGGWEVTLYEEKVALFERLDRSIRTANLSYLDHKWSLEEINKRAATTDGICYPLIDYGLLQNGVFPIDTIFPAIFVKTLVAQMLQEEGYSLTGDLPTNELYKRLIIPFSDEEPSSYDDQWRDDRYARVTLNQPTYSVDRGTLGKGSFVDEIRAYTIDNQPEGGFYQGKLKNYSVAGSAYVCDTAARIRVEATQLFKTLCVNGGVELILSVKKNGTQVVSRRFEAGTGYNVMFLRTDKLTLSETITCKAGDRLQIRLEARRFTDFGAFRFEIYNDPDNAFVSFTPDITTATDDTWFVARNLPDLSMKSLLVSLAYMLGGSWQVNRRRKQISFIRLSDVVAKRDQAVDWSRRVDTGQPLKWSPRLEPYAQANYLSWKETDDTKKAGTTLSATKTLNYGDGLIQVDAPVLETDTTLFEMAFAASTDSASELPAYGNPVLIKTRTTSGYGANLTINKQGTVARLLLVSLAGGVAVDSTRLKDDGLTSEVIYPVLKPCWFARRSDKVVTTEPAISLSFNPVPLNKGEKCLIELHFTGLQRILQRMRVVSLSMKLAESDVARLDYGLPIRLQRISVGGLSISDSCYILNKVDGYESGLPCGVTLIAF